MNSVQKVYETLELNRREYYLYQMSTAKQTAKMETKKNMCT